MVRFGLLVSAFVGLVMGLGDTDTITWGGDNSRSGYQTSHNMDPAVVGSSQFNQLFVTNLPGNYKGYKEQIFAQPLVYTPSGGDGTQYVYFATTQNNIYKLDAKTGVIVAQRSLHIPFLTADLDGCVDINPTVGIIGTGVIDPDTDTLYILAKTYENQAAGDGPQGRPAGRYYLHAINTNDLTERPNFPVDLQGAVARNNPGRVFNAGIQLQRPALLHTGQYIYAGFGSHCVQWEFTGWIMGWDKTTGKFVERFATQGLGVKDSVKGAAVWMSGGGLASDNAGSIFFATGNGYASQLATIPVNGFNPPSALEEAAVHMTQNADGTLNVQDFFMPFEKQALDGADKDLGTSPLQILPSEFSCGAVSRMGVITGKSGKTYWLNLDDLGGYRNGKDSLDNAIQVYQNENSVYAGAGVYPLEGGYIYINVIQYPTHVFKFSCTNGVPSFTKVADSPGNNAYILGVSHGTVTTLNNQPGTGLFWVTDVQGQNLKIYDAVPKGDQLNMIKSFSVPGTTKFTRAVFGDGIMYMGTSQGTVYGFGAPTRVPLTCTTGVDFGSVDITAESADKQITCTAVIGVTVSGVGLATTADFGISGVPNTPLQLAAGAKFSFTAKFHPKDLGFITGNININTTNSAAGYRTTTNSRLTGTGASAGAFFNLSPKAVTFSNIVSGPGVNGVTENVIVANQGDGQLDVTLVEFSTQGANGPFQPYSGTGPLTVGKFSVANIPKTVQAKSSVTLTITFDSTQAGSYTGHVRFTTSGGSGIFSITGSAGPAPIALVEFQSPDAATWVPYKEGTPFTFGNVTQNTNRALRMRVTNNAAAGGVRLSLTVSKPPFGVAGIIRAANQVDLAEGTSLGPGESASATLNCNVPKSQWNVSPFYGNATWTMNTNDPSFDKQIIDFACGAVSEQAPPLLVDGLGKYRYVGCFKENNPGRQLQSQLYGNNAATNPMCIDACSKNNWIFCGTQYHRECWAGNKIPTLRVDDINCNFDCSGALNQICGGNGEGAGAGGSYISLFADTTQFDGNTTTPVPPPGGNDPPPPPPPPAGGSTVNPGTDGYTSLGCYTEATQGRALPVNKKLDSTTVSNCVKACAADKYNFAGLQYASECWCGSALGTGAVKAPEANCNLACKGNATELCGGNSRLNIYQLSAAPPVSSSTSVAPPPVTSSSTSVVPPPVTSSSTVVSPPVSSSSSVVPPPVSSSSIVAPPPVTSSTSVVPPPVTTTSSTSSSPSPSPTGPAIKEKVSPNWQYQGCFTEGTGIRALNGKTYAKDDMTLESCADFCSTFEYFGTEYGRECYCGNQLNTGSIMAANQKDCSFLCAGDKTTYCGAGNRLQMYKKVSVAEGIPSSSSASSISSASSSIPSSSSVSSASSISSTSSSVPSSSSVPVTSSTLTTSSSSSSLSSSSSTVPSSSSSSIPATSSSSASATSSTSSSASSVSSTTSSAISSSTSISTTSTSIPPTSTTSKPAPTSTGPTVYEGNSNFTYYSCVQEPSAGKLLPKQIYNDGDNMTAQSCLERCWDSNYAGIEYGRECWCGDKINFAGNTGATPGKNVTDTQCTFLCPGDKKYFCGDRSKMTLYSNKRN